jgi:hypothetical protein
MSKPIEGENDLVDGAAAVGVATATIRLVVFSFISLILVAVGLYFILHPASETQSSTGTILTVTDLGQVPTTYDSDGNPIVSNARQLSLKVQYTCGSNTQLSFVVVKQALAGTYTVGGTIPIQFNPNQCSDVRAATTSNATVGWIVCGIGAALFLIGFAMWYTVRHSKAAAAVEGVSDIAGMFTSSLGGGGRRRRR